MDAASKMGKENDPRPVKLFFQDEARFGRIDTLVHCWAPRQIRPHLDQQIIRQYTHVFSAVCPQDGESFSLILPYADTEGMTIFLDAFSKTYSDYRVVVVMDGAPWHRTGKLRKFENIQIVFQPPYSPELNPVEHLWEHIREKYFWNRSWDSIEALEQALCNALREVSASKEKVRSLSAFNWLFS